MFDVSFPWASISSTVVLYIIDSQAEKKEEANPDMFEYVFVDRGSAVLLKLLKYGAAVAISKSWRGFRQTCNLQFSVLLRPLLYGKTVAVGKSGRGFPTL